MTSAMDARFNSNTPADQQAPEADMWAGEATVYGEPTILVVDPATRKLHIPVSSVIHTQALLRLDRVPSICMLFLHGRCRQGVNCHQLHADPAVVEMLRAEVSLRASCCPEHGEEVSQPSLAEIAPEVDTIIVDSHRVPSRRIATTNGMRRVISERFERQQVRPEDSFKASEVSVARSQVCRLHIQGRCRYAEDCNFIHLCRGLSDGDNELAKMLAGMASNTPSKSGRSSGAFNRVGSLSTPSSAFVPQMPPSPLYGGMPNSPLMTNDGFMPTLEHENSNDATPPNTPPHERSTPLSGPWRHAPYSWTTKSPVPLPRSSQFASA